MDNNQFNNNNQPVMNNESKKKGNSGLVILLLILLLAAVGYIGYDKFYASKQNSNNNETKEVEDNNVVENNDKGNNESIAKDSSITNEIKSYLIYDGKTIVDSSHGITIEHYNDGMSEKILYNGNIIIENLRVNNVYLIGDIIGVSARGGIHFYNLKGTEIKTIDLHNSGSAAWDPSKLYVLNNEIYFSSTVQDQSICGYIENHLGANKPDIAFSSYKIEYLGNEKFSELITLASYSYNEVC